MKILLFAPLLGIALFASSCRTIPTVDPMTMKPSERCQPDGQTCEVHGTK